jgi:hypothetical protein
MWPDLDPDSMAAYYFNQGIDSMLSGEEDEQPIECRYCHRRAFFWVDTPKGWRLETETGKLHQCGAYKAKKEKSR